MKRFFILINSFFSLLGFAANTVETHYITMNDGVKLYTVVAYPEKGKNCR